MKYVPNIVNPITGKTIRQENMEIQHKYPLGSLVEIIDGVRLYVVEHTRDRDGELLYSLYWYPPNSEEYKDVLDDNAYLTRNMGNINLFSLKGYIESSLKYVKY